MLKRLIVLWSSLTLTSFAARAASLEDAVSLQDQGKAGEAIALYEKAIEDGVVNGHLFYNLGHAYYRVGRSGDAMAAFLAARRYLPRDPDVRANLKYLLSKTRDKLEARVDPGLSGTIGFWVTRMTPREYAWLTAWTACVSGVLILAAFFVPRLRSLGLRPWALGSLIVPVICAVHLGASLALDQVWGAVVKPKAAVHSAPSRSERTLFELREGAPFLVTARIGGWYQIRLSDGKQGWIPDDAGRVIGI